MPLLVSFLAGTVWFALPILNFGDRIPINLVRCHHHNVVIGVVISKDRWGEGIKKRDGAKKP